MAWSPDGKRIVSASTKFDLTKLDLPGGNVSGEVKVWEARTGQELLNLKHTHGVHSVAWSPDGQRLASSHDQTVKVWEARTGKELLKLKGDTGRVTSVAWSPDGQRLARPGQRFRRHDGEGVGGPDRQGTAHNQRAQQRGNGLGSDRRLEP